MTNSYAVYEPFGAFSVQPTATNPSVTDRGFTGHRQNNTGAYDLKLIYMNARYYHPQLGRFVSPDTIVPEPGNPQSYNRYSYGYNNPVKYSDPSGHTPWDLLDVLSFALSVKDFAEEPSWANAGWLALDTLCLAPIVPSVGSVRHGAKLLNYADDTSDMLRTAGHLGDGAQAIVTATKLRRAATLSSDGRLVGLSDEGIQLVKALAEQSTHGSGSRVVIGQAVTGAGYVAEAQNKGGIYYETVEGVWGALGANTDLAWEVNRQFLENQLKSGIDRIDFFTGTGETVDWVIKNAEGTFRWKEIDYLERNAAEYGYERIGNSWVKRQ